MPKNVICIARSLAAGGEEAGQRVAQALSYRYADEEIIVRAAEEARVPKESVERAEQPAGVIGRILDTIGRAPIQPEVWAAGVAIAVPQATTGYDELIKQVVRKTAGEGDIVIVAHGASMALGERDGVLRVFVTGSPSKRAERLTAAGGTAQASEKAVEDSDRARRDYLRQFYGVRDESPAHYDLIINTDVISPEKAAELIVSAASV